MLAKESPVTSHYRDWVERYIYNRLSRCELHQVNSLVWRIDSGASRKIYIIFDKDDAPIAWLYLWQRKGWQAWEVMQSWCYPEHRGKGYGTKLYQAVINDDRLLLSSGNIHSKYSRAVWKSFIKKGLFNVWAQDFRDLDRVSVVEYDKDDDELVCELDLYDFRTSYEDFFYKYRPQDVRLLATRRTA